MTSYRNSLKQAIRTTLKQIENEIFEEPVNHKYIERQLHILLKLNKKLIKEK
jgi:hypothetical protein